MIYNFFYYFIYPKYVTKSEKVEAVEIDFFTFL